MSTKKTEEKELEKTLPTSEPIDEVESAVEENDDEEVAEKDAQTEESKSEEVSGKPFNPYNVWGYQSGVGNFISVKTQRKRKMKETVDDLHKSDASLAEIKANVSDSGEVTLALTVKDEKKENKTIKTVFDKEIATKKSLDEYKNSNDEKIKSLESKDEELVQKDEELEGEIDTIKEDYAKKTDLASYATLTKIGELEKTITALEERVKKLETPKE